MESIDLLMAEHKNIKRVLKSIRKLAFKVLEDNEVKTEAFYKVIDFVREYADKHHHSKEEDILFKKMEEELEEDILTPIEAMTNEHQMGRMLMQKLELALKEYENGNNRARLDIIANPVVYADMLEHHIDKEDEAIYLYAEANLSEKAISEIKSRVQDIEKKAEDKGVQSKYENMIQQIEDMAI